MTIALIVAITAGQLTAQTVDETKKIILTVKQGEDIRLRLQAAAENTKVKIVSGSNMTTITVGKDWTGYTNYRAGGTTMTITGAVTGFNCNRNGEKITAMEVSGNTALTELYCGDNKLNSLDISKNIALTGLYCFSTQLSSLDVSKNTALVLLDCGYTQLSSLDVSHNTALKYLSFHDNNFTTQSFNDLMCSLPIREANDNAEFYPLYDASDSKASAFQATNSTIAKNKNWKVFYYSDDTDIPSTTGSYVCPSTSFTEASTTTISLYPNPVVDVLYISTEEEVRSIHIYNVYGTEVASDTDVASISLRHLPAGVYLVHVKTDKGVDTQRMVKR